MLLVYIEEKAYKYKPKIRLQLISDLDDNKLPELAAECDADFLITGNTNDFTISNYKRTKIVTPKEYWDEHCLK
jgi:predicted nucleic acid-binding protein